MRRRVVYGTAAAVGLVAGATIGIIGRNCSHPSQPPFLQCVTEDPLDVLFPAFVLMITVIAGVVTVDLLKFALGHRGWLTLGMMALGVAATVWLVEGVGEICTQDGDVVGCQVFIWPESLLYLPVATATLGALGAGVSMMLERRCPR